MNRYLVNLSSDNGWYELYVRAPNAARAEKLADAFEASADYTETSDPGDYDVDDVRLIDRDVDGAEGQEKLGSSGSYR